MKTALVRTTQFLLAFFFLILFFSNKVKAQEKLCIDLKEYYSEINDRDEELFEGGNVYYEEARKNLNATLINLLGILNGNRIFCVAEDGELSQQTDFQENGLLGMVNNGIYSMLNTPLDSKWIAYYKDDFSIGKEINILAQTFPDPGSSIAPDPIIPPVELPISNSENTGFCEGGITYTDQHGDLVCIPNESVPEEADESKMEKKIREKMTEKLEESGILTTDSEGNYLDLEDWYEAFKNQNVSGYEYLTILGIGRWWQVSRNISYIFFVIIFIIVGFLIMFRKKISPELVITVGNSLPKLIAGLILVTFSFAIAGLFLDTGRVVLSAVTNHIRVEMFEKENLEEHSAGIEGMFDYYGNILDSYNEEPPDFSNIPIFGGIMTNALSDTGGTRRLVYKVGQFNVVMWAIHNITKNLSKGAPDLSGATFGISDIIFELINILLVVTGAIGQASLAFPLVVLLLVQGFALLVSVKLYISIFMTYFKIFIETIFAPFFMTVGSLPGKSNVIKEWFKRMLSAVLTFTAIVVIINLANYLAFSTMVNLPDINFFGTSGITSTSAIPFSFIIVLGGYFLASNVGKYLDAFLKIRDGGLVGGVKDSISKVPLIGGMFK
jgi:hypothetical protein